MIRRRALLIVTMMASVLSAAPASAQEGWRWLEKLSGPGDFYGYEVAIKLACHYNEVTAAERSSAEKSHKFAVSMPCVFKTASDGKGEKVAEGDAANPAHPYYARNNGGALLDLTQRLDTFGVGFSYLRGSGDLEYPATVEHVDRTVQLLAFEAFYDRKLPNYDRIDFGVAAGANLFIVPEADKFVRLSVEPRLTLKLFDLRKRDLYVGTAALRLGALFLFGRFEDVDFGAIPGTYQSSKVDVGPSFRLILDFDRNPFK